MAQLDRIAQAAFKKLFGLGSTEVKSFPIGNESDPSSITSVGRDVFAEAIAGTAAAVAGRIIDCTNATDGTATSRLTLTVNPAEGAAEGIAYYITVPASHGLIGQINPYDGSTIASGDRVRSIIPKRFGTTWRPIVYAAGPTEIPPLDASDWFLDERAGIAFFGTAPSVTPVRLACYVYVGKTLVSPLDVKVGGSGVDLSATGGAGPPVHYVKQAGVGAAFTVGTIAAADLPSLSGTYQPLDTDLTDLAGITRTRGDLIYGGASAWVDRSISATVGVFLRSDGTDPQWSTLVLPNALTSGAVLYGSSANVAASSAALAASQIVIGGGAGVAPATLGALGTTTQVLHGNAAGAPTFAAVSLTADVSGDLPFANLAQGSARSVLGVAGNATADVASIQGTTARHLLMVNSGGTGIGFEALGASMLPTHTHASSTEGGSVLSPTKVTIDAGGVGIDDVLTLLPNAGKAITGIAGGGDVINFTVGGQPIFQVTNTGGIAGVLTLKLSTSAGGGNYSVITASTMTGIRGHKLPDADGTFIIVGSNSDPAAANGTIATVNRPGQVANITPAVKLTSLSAAGFYQVNCYMACTVAGAGTVTSRINYTDDGGAKANQALAPLTMTGTTQSASAAKIIHMPAAGDITWDTTGYTSGTYSIRIRTVYLGP